MKFARLRLYSSEESGWYRMLRRYRLLPFEPNLMQGQCLVLDDVWHHDGPHFWRGRWRPKSGWFWIETPIIIGVTVYRISI